MSDRETSPLKLHDNGLIGVTPTPAPDERQAGLRAWLLAHEHHTLHYGREDGNAAGAIVCASPHNDGSDPHDLRFALARPVAVHVARDWTEVAGGGSEPLPPDPDR